MVSSSDMIYAVRRSERGHTLTTALLGESSSLQQSFLRSRPEAGLPGIDVGGYISRRAGGARTAATDSNERRTVRVSYRVLATDYDGTLATGGVVDRATLAAL